MSQVTYRYFIGDCKNALKIAMPDADITSSQVLFWIRTSENIIRQRHLKVERTGSFLTEFLNVPIQNDGNTPPKKWITLPAYIYDLMLEQGIDYISYQQSGVLWGGQTRFQQTTADEAPVLYYNPYTTPSPSSPYFYRVGQTIYLLGIENATQINVQMGLYSALDARIDYVNIDTPMGVNDEEINALREIVLQLGKFALLVPKDRVEDGRDDRNESLKTFAAGTSKNPPSQEQEQ